MKKAKKSSKSGKKTTRGSHSKKPKNAVGIEPLGDRILIKPLSLEERGKTLPSGIIIPDTVDKEKPDQGIVVAVGAGKRNDKGERITPDIKVGDKVYFAKPWNDPVKIEGVEYYVVSESDIYAVIR